MLNLLAKTPVASTGGGAIRLPDSLQLFNCARALILQPKTARNSHQKLDISLRSDTWH